MMMLSIYNLIEYLYFDGILIILGYRNFSINVGGCHFYKLYFDGVEQTNRMIRDSQKTDVYFLPAVTKVVAVEGRIAGSKPGIIASDGVLLTNSSWRCSNTTANNSWIGVKFNDSSWMSATEIGRNGIAPWNLLYNIKANASWIWNSNASVVTNATAYCRLVVGEFVYNKSPKCNWEPGTDPRKRIHCTCSNWTDTLFVLEINQSILKIIQLKFYKSIEW